MNRFLLLYVISLFIASGLDAQTLSVDAGVSFQKISGFGGMNFPRWISDLNTDQVDKAFGNAPGQLGLSILRISISPNSSQFQLEVPTAKAATRYGATVLGTPWSPPAALKTNNNTTAGELLPQNYGAYADHLLNFISFMKENGVTMKAVSIQNEPDISVDYESCFWSPQQMITFLKEQGPRFTQVPLMAAESFNFNRSKTDPILNDPDAEKFLGIVGGHIYGSGVSDYALARSKGKEVWMTEHYTESANSGNAWPLALNVGSEITSCMKVNFNAYIWWYIRRFYGLIDEDGNITKRGYIVSHFSKFIRPGATRVQATLASASNVDATAYKTDTSLVVVVVNKGSNPVNLTFSINNSPVGEMAKITTSATKSMVNDGIIKINNGSMTASVDASSITTFTSNYKDAGRYGNIVPVADAGPNLTRDIDQATGKAKFALDASASKDPDGTLVNYSWALNGKQTGWGPSLELELPAGSHNVTLTVTDNDGARSSANLLLTVQSSSQTELWFEAECAQLGSNWDILNAPGTASNGKYVMTKAGVQSSAAASEDAKYHLTFSFELKQAGEYRIWGRANTPTYDDDSFWLKVDNGSWARWNGIRASGSDWHWDAVRDENLGSDALVYSLAAGQHTLTVCLREDGAGLDKLLLTNSVGTPQDMGGQANNCGTGLSSFSSPLERMVIYPNPACNEITLQRRKPFGSVTIYSLEGRKVYFEPYSKPLEQTRLQLNLQPGTYILKLDNEHSTFTVISR